MFYCSADTTLLKSTTIGRQINYVCDEMGSGVVPMRFRFQMGRYHCISTLTQKAQMLCAFRFGSRNPFRRPDIYGPQQFPNES